MKFLRTLAFTSITLLSFHSYGQQSNTQVVIDVYQKQIAKLQGQIVPGSPTAQTYQDQIDVYKDEIEYLQKGYSPSKAANIAGVKAAIRVLSRNPNASSPQVAAMVEQYKTKLDGLTNGPKE